MKTLLVVLAIWLVCPSIAAAPCVSPEAIAEQYDAQISVLGETFLLWQRAIECGNYALARQLSFAWYDMTEAAGRLSRARTLAGRDQEGFQHR